jgi:hypothetical protein
MWAVLKLFYRRFMSKLDLMPNAPKTPTRTIRVSEELWAAAKEKAAIEERTLTDVLITALREYVGLDLHSAE